MLFLGDPAATLHEGRITPFDRTIDVHDRPVDLVTARTFADPPLNDSRVEKRGSSLQFGEHAPGHAGEQLADGPCTLALRPHHVAFASGATRTVGVPATVGTGEITGSKTCLHARAGGGADDGGAYALPGPSGCGKTTLLDIISGLLVPRPGTSASTTPTSPRTRPKRGTRPRCSSVRSAATRPS